MHPKVVAYQIKKNSVRVQASLFTFTNMGIFDIVLTDAQGNSIDVGLSMEEAMDLSVELHKQIENHIERMTCPKPEKPWKQWQPSVVHNTNGKTLPLGVVNSIGPEEPS